mmetsp:Transcript_11972/g.30358  ORF Transcript_11972/g.30358 Transcript_11972/m.30358 type:complete len:365 (+) Transcript_11972:194-1288(+)
MKVLVLSSLLFSASAFLAPQRPSYSSAVFSADVSDVEVSDVDVKLSVDEAKAELLSVAKDLKDEFGVLLIDSKAKESFKAAVEKLESVAEAPSDANLLVGEWTLVVSSSSSPASEKLTIDTSKIPFLKEGPVKDIQNTLNDSIEVVQSIKFGEESNSVDSIDHIIDYKPPSQLSSFVKNLPDAIRDLDINPLKVSETKVVLKHKAEVEGIVPVIKTKLSLEAVVLNVAGESKNLEPSGADVLGINIPFGDYLNAGSFETTFVDESMRISRSKTGPVDQLRVFVKAEAESVEEEDVLAEEDEELDDDEIVEDEELDDDEIVEDENDDDDGELAEESDESPIEAEIVEEEDDDGDDEIEPPSDIES